MTLEKDFFDSDRDYTNSESLIGLCGGLRSRFSLVRRMWNNTFRTYIGGT